MRDQKVTRELPFGSKSIARITVSRFEAEQTLDGQRVHPKTTISTIIEMVQNGQVVARDYRVCLSHYSQPWADQRVWDRNHLDPNLPLTFLADKVAVGDFATPIRAAIEEMEQEVLHAVGQQTAAEQQAADDLAEAKAIVAAAERLGADTLPSAAEVIEWKRAYNDLHNEGGEGYIPPRLSRERYEEAKALLAKRS